MSFGFTKSVLMMALVFALMGVFKFGVTDNMAITRILGPVLFFLIVMVPVFLIVDLRRWLAFRRLVRSSQAPGHPKPLPTHR